MKSEKSRKKLSMESSEAEDKELLTGELPYKLTNDFMFKALLQENEKALRGLLCALLNMKGEEIASVILTNPMEYGKEIEAKELILDIKLILNNQQIINIEMQVADLGNWEERSLTYLCRAFDQLNVGEDYKKVKKTIHIGILDFTPTNFPEEFYSEYVFYNKKTAHVYSDKIGIYVLQLSQLGNPEDAERMPELYNWAQLFKAKTWEEIQMLAQKSEEIKESVVTLKQLTADEKMKMRMEARERYHNDLAAAENFGMSKGISRGMEIGRTEGVGQGMKAFVESCQELGVTYTQAFDKLMTKFELDPKEAEQAMKKYWQTPIK